MEISAEEFIGKFQEMFPKESTIALQALQISKMQDELSNNSGVEVPSEDDDGTE